MHGPPISAACGIWGNLLRKTPRSRRDSFSSPSISTRPLREPTELSPWLTAKRLNFKHAGLPETLSSAVALARRAVALDGADAEARSHLCYALYRSGDYEGALAEAERALAMTPNLAHAHHMLGATLIFSGQLKEGLAALERSVRLDPRGPRSAARLNQIALGYTSSSTTYC